jgi:hypothetical protein
MPADDLLSPFPVAGVEAYLAPPRAAGPIGWVMFVAGVAGAIAGYGMQWYSAVIDYPLLSGGRPLNSWPAFLLVPYETAILSAAVIGVLGWLRICGLPQPFHPLFAGSAVERATQDRYLLVFQHSDTCAEWVGSHLKPCAIHEIRA